MNIDWPLVFEGMKTILDPLADASWPIMIGIIVWGFRKPIGRLIERIKRVGGGGLSVELGPSQGLPALGTVGGAEASPIPSPAESGELPMPEPPFDEMDEEFSKLLDQHVKGGEEAKLAWAIRMRSISEAFRICESVHRSIFGSQIQALKTLNQFGKQTRSGLEPFYTAAASNSVWSALYQDRSFDQWLEFLTNSGLVSEVKGSDPPAVEITSLGRRFLQWMPQVGALEFKPG